MKGKVNKASLGSGQSDVLYKSIIKKSVMFFCLLLFVSVSIMVYFTADLYAQYCVERIGSMESVTKVGLNDFMLTQKRQIACIKKRFKKAAKLKDFSKLLSSCNFLEIDKFLINYDGKVIYSTHQVKTSNLDYYNDKSLGFSFDELKNNPNKIFIGNIVEDQKLNSKYFFIASEVYNKNSNFKGVVLLKIDVNYLNERIVFLESRFLTIRDNVDEYELQNSIYKQLKEFPVKTFLSIFLDVNPDTKVVRYNSSLNKYTESRYKAKSVLESLYHNIVLFGCVVFTLLIIVFYAYWRIILLPMKESMMMIQRNGSGRKNIGKLFSIFYRLNDFNLNQTALISKQEQEQREQFAKIISLIFSIGSLVQYVTSKVEVLKEDISDMFSKSNKKISSNIDFSRRLRELEKTIANSERDIRSLTSEYTKFTELIKTQKKENIVIDNYDLGTAIKSKLYYLNYNQTILITPKVKFDIEVYKSFFIMLIDEILNFNKEALLLTEIKISSNKKLQFIFEKINVGFVGFQNEQITLCKMLGMYNDIKVSIFQDQETVAIKLNFNPSIKN